MIAKAVSPLALAALWSATGEPRMVFAGVLALVFAGVVGLRIATRARQRHALATCDGMRIAEPSAKAF